MHNRDTTRFLDGLKTKERKSGLQVVASAHLIAFECSVVIASWRIETENFSATIFLWSILFQRRGRCFVWAVKYAVSITCRQYITKVLSDVHFGNVWSHHRVSDVYPLFFQYNNTFITQVSHQADQGGNASRTMRLSAVRDHITRKKYS